MAKNLGGEGEADPEPVKLPPLLQGQHHLLKVGKASTQLTPVANTSLEHDGTPYSVILRSTGCMVRSNAPSPKLPETSRGAADHYNRLHVNVLTPYNCSA